MGKETKKIKTKDLGLFLVVLEDKDYKHIFYKSYFTEEEIHKALAQDEELKDLIKVLKPLDLIIYKLIEEETKTNE